MHKAFSMILGLALAVAGSAAMGQSGSDPLAFPAEGQSEDQQQQDEFACLQWARNRTGFDPLSRPEASSAPPPDTTPDGNMVGDAARGAVVGSVIGGITGGDWGRGAAAGAAGGALLGGMSRSQSRRQSERQQEEWAQREMARYNQRRAEYNRAWSACMEGKGYTVR